MAITWPPILMYSLDGVRAFRPWAGMSEITPRKRAAARVAVDAFSGVI